MGNKIKDSFYYYLTFCVHHFCHIHAPPPLSALFIFLISLNPFSLPAVPLVHFMAVAYVCEKVVLSLIQIAVTSIGE